MAIESILSNVLNVPVLFFFLGMLSTYIKSDLDIPQPLPKLFSLYLLFSIGIKGGVELSHSGLNNEVVLTLGLAILMAFLVPVYSFYALKRKVGIHDAGAIAATFGSISAVTFVTACAFLDGQGVSYGGHMVASMALMESPAIIVGVFLIRYHLKDNEENSNGYGSIIKEALTNGSVVLILGSLLIGLVANEKDLASLEPFTGSIFKGMLTFFLLDMGILAGKRIKSLRQSGSGLLWMSILIPLFNAAVGIACFAIFDLSIGNAFLLTVLFASASYIAVPAAMRITVPEANPGLYVSLSLALIFPFNIILGLPLYFSVLTWIQSVLN
ncbi:MAG: sodium-dependent bicarbonate transport family permease [Bacteroidota bacterium]